MQGFITYIEDVDILRELLTAEQVGLLFLALNDHAAGRAVNVPQEIATAYALLAKKIDRDAEKYKAISDKRRAAAGARWNNKSNANDANASDAMQTMPYGTETETGTGTETETGLKNKRASVKFLQRDDNMTGILMEL